MAHWLRTEVSFFVIAMATTDHLPSWSTIINLEQASYYVQRVYMRWSQRWKKKKNNSQKWWNEASQNKSNSGFSESRFVHAWMWLKCQECGLLSFLVDTWQKKNQIMFPELLIRFAIGRIYWQFGISNVFVSHSLISAHFIWCLCTCPIAFHVPMQCWLWSIVLGFCICFCPPWSVCRQIQH